MVKVVLISWLEKDLPTGKLCLGRSNNNTASRCAMLVVAAMVADAQRRMKQQRMPKLAS